MLEQLANEGITTLKQLITQVVPIRLSQIKDREDISRLFLHKIPELALYLKKHDKPQ
jgi:hypothetical protein